MTKNSGMTISYITHSAEETIALGMLYGKNAHPGDILCFSGDLAAGKTTFISGFIRGVLGDTIGDVTSPTFVYMNIYTGSSTVCHFDLYRINTAEEFVMMGFDEYFNNKTICCIEWPERIEGFIPKHHIRITMEHEGESSRKIVITNSRYA